MTTLYPAALDSYTVKVDGVTDVLASHVNNVQDAIVAIQTLLGAQAINFARPNILINGGVSVWQRTTDDTAVTTTRKYVADRWAVQTGAGTLSNVRRSTTIRSGGRSKYSMEMVGATGVTTVNISQRIETIHVALYKQTLYFTGYIYNGSGAAFTPKIYLSTPSAADNWASSTVRNGGGSGENLQSCADAAWTKVSWSADVSGYTNIDNGLEVRLEIPSGSLVAGDTVRLAECNLVPVVETPYIERLYPIELELCKWYYEVIASSGITNTLLTNGMCFSSTDAGGALPYRPKRINPSISVSAAGHFSASNSGGGLVAATSIATPNAGRFSCTFQLGGLSGLTAGDGSIFYITDATGAIYIDAEL